MERLALLLIVTPLLLLVGCDDGEGGVSGGSSEPPLPPASEEVPGPPPVDIEAMTEDVDGAVRVIDAYWQAHWTDFFTDTYRAPAVSGGYFGSDNPACGGKATPLPGNAYYCPSEDYIAWDWNLLASQYDDATIGDAFIYYLLAHEWAHAIQARLDRSIVSVASELQADCLAAATLNGAAADGILTWEEGDRGEIFESLAEVGDDYEWGDPTHHGAADQRIEAYQQGERGGVNACLARGG